MMCLFLSNKSLKVYVKKKILYMKHKNSKLIYKNSIVIKNFSI